MGQGLVAEIRGATLARWLSQLGPSNERSGISRRDANLAEKPDPSRTPVDANTEYPE
jgi:hypothetical protein